MTFVIRGTSLSNMARASRQVATGLDAGLAIAGVRPMPDVVGEAIGQPRFTMLVMGFFAGIALFLGALGLYGVLAHGVEGRTREIGIRMALGADRRTVLRLIIGQGLSLVAAGVALGLPAALLFARWGGALLVGISAHDAPTYITVVATLVATVLLASYFPARRAARVDSLLALKID